MNVFLVPAYTQPTSALEVSTKTFPSASSTTFINGRPNSVTASTKQKNSSQITASGKAAPKILVSFLPPTL